MSTFGNLLESNPLVLIGFYTKLNLNNQAFNTTLSNLQAGFGQQVSVVKMDVLQNDELCTAIRIDKLPAYILFNKQKRVWRTSGDTSEDVLITIINKQLKTTLIPQ